MINDPQVSMVQSPVEADSRQQTHSSSVFARTIIATALMAVAIAALAVTSLAQSDKVATTQTVNVVQAAPPELPLSVPLNSGEVAPFAFGFLVFENDPANGVPGFGPLPPRSSAR